MSGVRYRIFKGRPEWGATIPGRPWTVLRTCLDGGWGTIACRPTWLEAWAVVRADWLARER